MFFFFVFVWYRLLILVGCIMFVLGCVIDFLWGGLVVYVRGFLVFWLVGRVWIGI